MQFYQTGVDLQIAVVKLIMSESKVPKKWRFTIGNLVIKTTGQMMANIIEANNIYANTQAKLEERLSLQTRALANVKQLDQQIQLLHNVIPTVTTASIKEISRLICEEEEHLRKWKKITKLVNK